MFSIYCFQPKVKKNRDYCNDGTRIYQNEGGDTFSLTSTDNIANGKRYTVSVSPSQFPSTTGSSLWGTHCKVDPDYMYITIKENAVKDVSGKGNSINKINLKDKMRYNYTSGPYEPSACGVTMC